MDAALIRLFLILYLYLGALAATVVLSPKSIYVAIGIVILWPLFLIAFITKSIYKALIYLFTGRE